MNAVRRLTLGAVLIVITIFCIAFFRTPTLDAGLSASQKSGPAEQNLQTYHARRGWELVWSDEFNKDSLDPTKWAAETSCWGGGNNERQCYTDRPENIEVRDGILRLMARAEDFTGPQYPQDWADRGDFISRKYTSGKVRTKGLKHWKYGRFEARIKLPQGQSTWPAFWMLPTDNHYGKWPLSGEIDIMESINLGAKCEDCEGSTTENRSSAALHFGQLWPENQFRSQKNTLPYGVDAYHIFAIEWGQDQIDWFVNDSQIFTMTHDEWFTAAARKSNNPFAPFDQPFYLMLNLAVGGNLPDSRNETAFNPNSFPAELHVDWVRVYQCTADKQAGKSCMLSK